MTIKNISEYKDNKFLGIDFANWIAICGILLTFVIATVGLSSKVSAIETKTNTNKEQIEECKNDSKRIDEKVSDINGAVNRIDGKLDILLQRTK